MNADAMPIYDMIEYQMVKRNIPNGWVSRLIYRVIYVVIVAFIAITIPFFGSLLVSSVSSEASCRGIWKSTKTSQAFQRQVLQLFACIYCTVPAKPGR